MPLTQQQKVTFLSSGGAIDNFATITQPVANRLLIMALSCDDNLDATNPVYTSDGANGNIVNFNTTAGQFASVVNATRVAIYWKLASGVNETRVHVKNVNASGVACAFAFFEYSGGVTSAAMDVSGTNTNATTTVVVPAAASATTVQGDELVIAVWGQDQAGTWSALTNGGAGSLSPTWTVELNGTTTGVPPAGSTNQIIVGSAPVSATGTLQAQVTDSTTAAAAACIATFKAALAGAGAPVVSRSRLPTPRPSRGLLNMSRIVSVPSAGVPLGLLPSVTYAYTAN